ncbi:MAG: aminopeptidase [Desulfobacterales bacterium]
MLSEHELEGLSRVLWWGLCTARREPFHRGDIVVVRCHEGALRLAERLYAELLRRGLNPVLRLSPTPAMERALCERGSPPQLDFLAPGETALARRLNGNISLLAPQALTHLERADPAAVARLLAATRGIRRILERRESQGRYGWTLCVLPTAALARQAGMGQAAYARAVARACLLDRPDPVAAWREVHRRVAQIRARLDELAPRELVIASETCDLRIRPGERRRWVGVSGRNLPSFEIFLSPDWRGTEGVFTADQPSFRNGNLVRGVRLEFRAGRLVRARAREGQAFLRAQLAIDPGASRVGEFSLTDRRLSPIDRFMAQTLYDENFGGEYGNCHIALGSAYANTYAGDPRRLSAAARRRLGFNDSALHWDFVNTEPKRVTAVLRDGSRMTIYENGEFCAALWGEGGVRRRPRPPAGV